jgi:hypothetical protein
MLSKIIYYFIKVLIIAGVDHIIDLLIDSNRILSFTTLCWIILIFEINIKNYFSINFNILY